MSAAVKHTPGPWRVSWDECRVTGVQDGHTACLIAITESPGNQHTIAGGLVRGAEIQRANTRLIAAAPDLLEACKAMAAHWRKTGWPQSGPESEAQRLVRAAIAKAEGGAS